MNKIEQTESELPGSLGAVATTMILTAMLMTFLFVIPLCLIMAG